MEIDGYPAIPAFYFDADRLRRIADEHRDRFRSARPYPHLVIDGLVPDAIVARVADEFPAPDAIREAWRAESRPEEELAGAPQPNKLGASDERLFGPFTRHFIAQLNSRTFVDFVERLTGVSRIVTDPSYEACGLHSTGRGGKLAIHTDTSRHPDPRCAQRINVIFYVNRDWDESWGGHLELWDPTATRCVTRVAPLFNRCLIFATDEHSNHGHPHPLECPPDRRRNSVAVYYYTFESQISSRPLTNFHATTNDEFRWAWRTLPSKLTPRAVAMKVVPPLGWDIARYVRRRWLGKDPYATLASAPAVAAVEPPRREQVRRDDEDETPSRPPRVEQGTVAMAAKPGQ